MEYEQINMQALALRPDFVAVAFGADPRQIAEGWGVVVSVRKIARHRDTCPECGPLPVIKGDCERCRGEGTVEFPDAWGTPRVTWEGFCGQGIDVALMVSAAMRTAARFDIGNFARLCEADGLLKPPAELDYRAAADAVLNLIAERRGQVTADLAAVAVRTAIHGAP